MLTKNCFDDMAEEIRVDIVTLLSEIRRAKKDARLGHYDVETKSFQPLDDEFCQDLEAHLIEARDAICEARDILKLM